MDNDNPNLPYDYDEYEENDSEPDFHHEEVSVGSNAATGKKRKSTSSVWSCLTRFEAVLDDGTTYPFARCNTCGHELAADTKHNGTSNLRWHLKRCQGSLLYKEEESNQTILTQSAFGTLTSIKFDQKRLKRRCIAWIISAELSFRTVEHDKFKEFINDLQPKFKIPNRKAIARGVLELFLTEKEKLETFLGGVRVSLTTDTWTSIQNINYMVVTAHFIDEDWSLQKRIISFKKIISHRGDEMGKALDGCLLEWGIQNVFSVTLDNASANDGLIEYVKRRLSGRGTLLCGGTYLHMRCACHILNLIVKDGMKELGSSIESIRNCVKFIHSSPLRLDLFRKTAIAEGFPPSSTIGLDVVTRWNSTYMMLKSAQKFRSVFAKMADDCNTLRAYFEEERRDGPPTDEQWDTASSLAIFLEGFYKATIDLSATKSPTSTIILQTILPLLELILLKAGDPTNKIMQRVAESMKKKFDKYWLSVDEVCPIMFVAQVLDPRSKFAMIKMLLKRIRTTPEKIAEVEQSVKAHLDSLYDEYKKKFGNISVVEYASTSSTTPESTHSDVDVSSSSCVTVTPIWKELEAMLSGDDTPVVKGEVDIYYNEKHENISNASFDLLSWWKLNYGRFPILSMIAKDVFAIPSSSVASETAFSLGGRVIDPFRSSLTPKTVEALVCASDWIRGEKYQFYKEPNEDEVELYKELEEVENDVTIPATNEVVLVQPTPTHAPIPTPTSTPTSTMPQSERGRGTSDRGRGRASSGRARGGSSRASRARRSNSSGGRPPLPKRGSR